MREKVSEAELLASRWQLLRIEIYETDVADMGRDVIDGYSRYWCQEAILGVYWIAESAAGNVDIQLTGEIELEGFRAELGFRPDSRFKEMLLDRCDWQGIVREVLNFEEEKQLPLFEGVDDE